MLFKAFSLVAAFALSAGLIISVAVVAIEALLVYLAAMSMALAWVAVTSDATRIDLRRFVRPPAQRRG
ncbi:MAG: hypothetical protein PGN13_12655 [Patulibacter minatonensis]